MSVNDLLNIKGMDVNNIKRCPACSKHCPTMKRCGACQKVFYCDADCQKEDWTAEHKKICSQLKESAPTDAIMVQLKEKIDHKCLKEYVGTFGGHEPLKQLLKVPCKFVSLSRKPFPRSIRIANRVMGEIDVFIGHEPPGSVNSKAKIVNSMDDVNTELMRGKRTFVDFPLRSFFRYGTDGHLCDDTFYADMENIFRSLAKAVVADIQQPIPGQRKTEVLIALPFVPDAEWFQKFTAMLKFPIVYFVEQVPLDARMKFTIYEPGAPPQPGDVPISSIAHPYVVGLLYVGERHPWTEKLPKRTTTSISQCWMFEGLREEYKKMNEKSDNQEQPSPHPVVENNKDKRTPARPTKEDIELAQAVPKRNYMDEQD